MYISSSSLKKKNHRLLEVEILRIKFSPIVTDQEAEQGGKSAAFTGHSQARGQPGPVPTCPLPEPHSRAANLGHSGQCPHAHAW